VSQLMAPLFAFQMTAHGKKTATVNSRAKSTWILFFMTQTEANRGKYLDPIQNNTY